jgi:hypothetical protein
MTFGQKSQQLFGFQLPQSRGLNFHIGEETGKPER